VTQPARRQSSWSHVCRRQVDGHGHDRSR
jgi:hypothetical protein